MLSKNFLYFSVVNIIISLIDVEGIYDCSVSINKGFLDEWSACSKTCGEGTTTKLNCEDGKNCVTLCNLKPCPCKLIKFFHDNVKKWYHHVLSLNHFWKGDKWGRILLKYPFCVKPLFIYFLQTRFKEKLNLDTAFHVLYTGLPERFGSWLETQKFFG